MANERAPGVSFIYAVQTWRQLAPVAEPARLRQDPDHRLGWRRAPARAPQPSPSRWGGHRLVVFPDRKSAEVVGLQSSPSSRSAARWPLASQSGRSRWWAARQTIPRGRVRADPRFDAVRYR
jgi:hypothetical protein